MTTLFFIIVGFVVLLFLMLMAILHVGAVKPEPKQLVRLNPYLLDSKQTYSERCNYE